MSKSLPQQTAAEIIARSRYAREERGEGTPGFYPHNPPWEDASDWTRGHYLRDAEEDLAAVKRLTGVSGPCPMCGAEPGEPCVGLSTHDDVVEGEPRPETHFYRPEAA